MPKLARVRVSYDILAQLLHFPEDVRIRRIIPSNPQVWQPTYMEVVIESDDLPVRETLEGEMIPEVSADIFMEQDH